MEAPDPSTEKKTFSESGTIELKAKQLPVKLVAYGGGAGGSGADGGAHGAGAGGGGGGSGAPILRQEYDVQGAEDVKVSIEIGKGQEGMDGGVTTIKIGGSTLLTFPGGKKGHPPNGSPRPLSGGAGGTVKGGASGGTGGEGNVPAPAGAKGSDTDLAGGGNGGAGYAGRGGGGGGGGAGFEAGGIGGTSTHAGNNSVGQKGEPGGKCAGGGGGGGSESSKSIRTGGKGAPGGDGYLEIDIISYGSMDSVKDFIIEYVKDTISANFEQSYQRLLEDEAIKRMKQEILEELKKNK